MDKIIADNDKNLPDGKKKRVLYHIGHYGFLSKMLLHKMAYHKNDDIIFVLNLSACSEKTREFASGWNKRNSDIGKMYGYFERAFMHGPNVHSLENEIVSSFDGFF